MYKIYAIMTPPEGPFSTDALLGEELPRIQRLIDVLRRQKREFATIGVIVPDVQARIDRIIEETEARGEEITDAMIEQFDRMAASGRVTISDNPDQLYSAIRLNAEELARKYEKTLGIDIRTAEGRSPGQFTRTIADGISTLSLTMYMSDKDDFWFADLSIMRSMLSEIVSIWDPTWAVATPAMYLGRSGMLFKDRQAFGWMGYTREVLTETGDALAQVAPMGKGTFMLLQESIMTLKRPDIERCNKAEAFLADRGLLPLVGTR